MEVISPAIIAEEIATVAKWRQGSLILVIYREMPGGKCGLQASSLFKSLAEELPGVHQFALWRANGQPGWFEIHDFSGNIVHPREHVNTSESIC